METCVSVAAHLTFFPMLAHFLPGLITCEPLPPRAQVNLLPISFPSAPLESKCVHGFGKRFHELVRGDQSTFPSAAPDPVPSVSGCARGLGIGGDNKRGSSRGLGEMDAAVTCGSFAPMLGVGRSRRRERARPVGWCRSILPRQRRANGYHGCLHEDARATGRETRSSWQRGGELGA